MKNAIDIYNDGYYYYTGSNMYPFNYQRAFDCFREAADLGVAEAMNYLGVMYEKGEAVAKDFSIALDWYKKAADAGSPFAMRTLGVFYMEGRGVPRNEEIAYEYFEGAYATNQDPYSAYRLGCKRMENQQYLEAAHLFKCAAERGKIAEAWHNLGVLIGQNGIRMGSGDAQSQAMFAYKRAAELGYAPAMYVYGCMILNTSRNLDNPLGWEWIRKSADAGYEQARKILKAHRFSKSGSVFDLFGR